MADGQGSVESVERMSLDFYRGKRVLLTGHTGFKGRWLSKILLEAGAEVAGLALPPATPEDEAVFKASGVAEGVRSYFGDVADFAFVKHAFSEMRPEIVFHLAAQPIVLESYRNPVHTYATNVMGTVHVLECVRKSDSVRSVLNVTTDKVYRNNEWPWGYRESDVLAGRDPYSNSKSCSELVTESYRQSFLEQAGVAVSTARAGNVIGGGDFVVNRIVPDCIRAALAGRTIEVRNPGSIRPYQHVLEPLFVYLMIAELQAQDAAYAGAYNVGPEARDTVTTGELATLFCEAWGEGARWETHAVEQPHEAGLLRLDCSKLRSTFGWQPVWSIREAIERTVEWAKVHRDGSNIADCMSQQIQAYEAAFQKMMKAGKDGKHTR